MPSPPLLAAWIRRRKDARSSIAPLKPGTRNTRLEEASIAFPRARRNDGSDYEGHVYLSARGGFGSFLKRRTTLPQLSTPLKPAEIQEIIPQLFFVLSKAGLVQTVHMPEAAGDTPGYQVPASAFVFCAGSGIRAFHDPLRMPNAPADGRPTNAFFVRYYREEALKTKGIEVREVLLRGGLADRPAFHWMGASRNDTAPCGTSLS